MERMNFNVKKIVYLKKMKISILKKNNITKKQEIKRMWKMWKRIPYIANILSHFVGKSKQIFTYVYSVY